jgi:hypothetical protein
MERECSLLRLAAIAAEKERRFPPILAARICHTEEKFEFADV